MKQLNDIQLALNFDTPNVRRIVSRAPERARDSAGKFATDLVEANDKISRLITEIDIYRTNYLTVARQLANLQHQQHDNSNRL